MIQLFPHLREMVFEWDFLILLCHSNRLVHTAYGFLCQICHVVLKVYRVLHTMQKMIAEFHNFKMVGCSTRNSNKIANQMSFQKRLIE